jgi:hypothetical protein
VVRVLLVTLTVAFVVLMVLGFAIGYTIAPHDKLVLGSIGALAGAAVHMVGCWVLVAVLAARWRDSPEEISLWPHPPGSRGTWALLAPAVVIGVAALVSVYNHAPIGVTIVCIGVSAALKLSVGFACAKRSRTPVAHWGIERRVNLDLWHVLFTLPIRDRDVNGGGWRPQCRADRSPLRSPT